MPIPDIDKCLANYQNNLLVGDCIFGFSRLLYKYYFFILGFIYERGVTGYGEKGLF